MEMTQNIGPNMFSMVDCW